MPAIKLQQLNSIHSRPARRRRSFPADYPGTIEGAYGLWHSTTNYLKSYCRIKRHGVNNSKALCWLTLALILLADRSGPGVAFRTAGAAAAGAGAGPGAGAGAGGLGSSPPGGVSQLEIGKC